MFETYPGRGLGRFITREIRKLLTRHERKKHNSRLFNPNSDFSIILPSIHFFEFLPHISVSQREVLENVIRPKNNEP